MDNEVMLLLNGHHNRMSLLHPFQYLLWQLKQGAADY